MRQLSIRIFATAMIMLACISPVIADIAYDLSDEKQAELFLKTWANDIDNRAVTPDGMSGRVTGGDPYINGVPVTSPKEELNFLILEMSVNTGGRDVNAQFFYNVGVKGEESGCILIPLNADGKMHRYAVDLAGDSSWAKAAAIKNFRLDPIDLGKNGDLFVIKSLKLAQKPDQADVAFEFADKKQAGLFLRAWANDMDNRAVTPDGLSGRVTGGDPYFSNVPVTSAKEGLNFLILEMSVNTGGRNVNAQFSYNAGVKGEEGGCISVPLNADGKMHRYVVDLTKDSSWAKAAAIKNFRLDPIDLGKNGDLFVIKSLKLAKNAE
jgi:hypothetical protein